MSEQISKDLFQEMKPEQRVNSLRDNCYKSEETTVTRPLSKEQVADYKDKVTDSSVDLSSLQEEKESAVKKFDALMKPIKQNLKESIKALRDKSVTSVEEVFMLDDQEAGVMEIYDAEGKFLYSRRLAENERQTTILSISKAG